MALLYQVAPGDLENESCMWSQLPVVPVDRIVKCAPCKEL